MKNSLMLRGKWTFRAHGRQVVFIKKSNEKATHVLMKAFIWALYLTDYPDLTVEVPIGNRYKPDVVQTDAGGHPVFWGESGHVNVQKVRYLVERYRKTHIAIAKWDTELFSFTRIVEKALKGICRSAPIDMLSFPADSTDQFIGENGELRISLDKVKHIRL
ncbi:hypothetical protein DENIS_0353 [Desulfonema ishimotonii]|uniref:Uncharacterized protein n=1 Tax=Desulfonema ishimotonii TaxID=45657 RepID=A0A401FR28_9BACT|nr:hypothetical protein [Desulfonema ishimotonii]GBC59414.1 hypothetical protein DENIS_0353 [Desulfonema ishimotonii]